MNIDKPSYFIVDLVSKKRIESAFTAKGITDKVAAMGAKVLDRLRNGEGGYDLLVEVVS